MQVAKLDLTRQSAVVPSVEDFSATAIGIGTHGSNVVRMWASIGIPKIYVWDGDVVEPGNVAPATFGLDDIGEPKVHALQRRLNIELGARVIGRAEDFHGQDPIESNVVYLAVDSLEGRKKLWDLFLDGTIKADYILDSRGGREVVELYSIHKDDDRARAWYEHTLNYRADPTPCGEKATAFICGGVVPYLVGSVTTAILRGKPVPPYMYANAWDFLLAVNRQVPDEFDEVDDEDN